MEVRYPPIKLKLKIIQINRHFYILTLLNPSHFANSMNTIKYIHIYVTLNALNWYSVLNGND